jgi:hypothetical protein
MSVMSIRRSGAFVTAFATISTATSSRRTVTGAGSNVDFISRSLQSSASTLFNVRNGITTNTITTAAMATSPLHPSFVRVQKSNRIFDNIASRRSRLSSSATATIDSTTGSTNSNSIELQKKMDITHPAYEVLQKDIVTEYGAYCTLYRHIKSGAELLSVAVDDDNKVFGITLRTPPDDSTGVPHILEHSVLCGSRKYKTKDPFVHLLKGSLQTFLNAFTYPDRTCYVVASQNEKDFYNLVNVYADAVYHPRAVSDPMVHAQEGWHLELDENNKLIYNGVV